MASSSSSGSRELLRLRELPCGVVRTFKPTYAELAGYYLYGKIMMMVRGVNGEQAFPELEVYGDGAMGYLGILRANKNSSPGVLVFIYKSPELE